MAEPAVAEHPAPIQPQAYDEAGRPIAAEDTPRAVAEGKAFFQPGAKVYVRNENGVFGTVAPEDVNTPGYTVLTPEEIHHEHVTRKYGSGVGNSAKALAYGAARGLTLSGSDIAATGIGGKETAEEIEGLKEAHPYLSVGGEIAGAAAPLLLSGGTAAPAEAANVARGASLAGDAVRAAGWAPRLASRAGSLVERGVERGLETLGYEGKTAAGRVLAKTAAGAAGGAAEAALYGAGHGTAEQVLAGDDISAEKILATMGHEALWGAGIGGALAGAGAAGGEGARLVAKRGVSKELGDFATERGLKAVGRDTEKMFKDLSPAERAVKRHAVGEDLFYKIQTGEFKGQRVIDAAESPEQILAKLHAAKSENGAALGGLKDELNAKMLERPEMGPKLEELQKLRDDMAKEFRARGTQGSMSNARRVESEFNVFLKKHEPVVDEAGAVVHQPAPPTFLDVDNFRRALDSDLNPKGVPMAMRAMAVGEKAQALEKVTRGLSDYLKEKASTALQTLGEDSNAYNELSRKYASFNALEKVADKTVSAGAKNRTISPSDHGLGMMGFLGALITGNVGALGAMGVGAAASIANKLVRERGNSLLASWARDASRVDTAVQAAANSMAGAKAVTRFGADDVGAGAGALRRIGEKAKVATAATANNTLPAAIPDEAPAGGKKVPRMEPTSLQDRYTKTANRVRELSVAENAQDHMSRVVAESAPAHPELATALSGKMLQTYQYLGSKLPPSTAEVGTTLTPHAVKERVSPVAMRSFLSAADGALDPMGVIRSLAKGEPPAREAIDAMKVVYPKLFQQLRTQVADEVSQRQEELPYKRRVMLSMTFDFVGDSSLEPARLAGLQQAAKTLSVQDAAQDAAAIKPLQAKSGNPGVSKLGKSLTPPMDAAFAGVT